MVFYIRLFSVFVVVNDLVHRVWLVYIGKTKRTKIHKNTLPSDTEKI